MTDYDVKVPGHMVSSLMSDKGGFGSLLEVMLNQILEAQVSEQIGAERYERSDGRGAYRNGRRPRQLVTRVGPITLRIPQLRDGVFSLQHATRKLMPDAELPKLLDQFRPRGHQQQVTGTQHLREL